MAKTEVPWFGDSGTPKKIVRKTGRGIVRVGAVIGAGILVGMGFSAFQDQAENY